MANHQPDRTTLERAEAAIRAEARATDQDYRRQVAENYERSSLAFAFYLPTELAAEALTSRDHRVTWRVVRALCGRLRALRKEYRPVGVGTMRILITCELHLWRKQKDAAASRAKYERDKDRALGLTTKEHFDLEEAG